MTESVAFLGAGSIVTSILAGLLQEGAFRPEQIVVHNRRHDEQLEALRRRYGVQVEKDKAKLLAENRILLASPKPKDMAGLLQEIRPYLRADHLLISVAAGLSTKWLTEQLGVPLAVIRAMPNTSASVRQSATALSKGTYVTGADGRLAETIFAAIGPVFWVEEAAMDAVTAVAGSGPAFIYYMVEAMEEAAVREGLSQDLSRQLVRQTLLGAAQMLKQPGALPRKLREQVTSPGGTTMRGLEILEKRGFQEAIIEAVRGAAARSRELGQ